MMLNSNEEESKGQQQTLSAAEKQIMSNVKQNMKFQVNGINHKMPYDGRRDVFMTMENLNLLSLNDPVIQTIHKKKNYCDLMMKAYGVKLFIEIQGNQVIHEAGQ